MADAFSSADPFALAPADIVERVLAQGLGPKVTEHHTEMWPTIGRVFEIRRYEQDFLVAVSRDAQEISVQEVRADTYMADRMNPPIFTLDRTWLPMRVDLVSAISSHLDKEETVRVEDSEWLAGARLRYIVKRLGDAILVFDGQGQPLGVFAALDALAEHAERMTA